MDNEKTSLENWAVLLKKTTAIFFIINILFGNYLLIKNLTGSPISGFLYDMWMLLVVGTLASGAGYIFLSALVKWFGKNSKNDHL